MASNYTYCLCIYPGPLMTSVSRTLLILISIYHFRSINSLPFLLGRLFLVVIVPAHQSTLSNDYTYNYVATVWRWKMLTWTDQCQL